MLGVKDDGRYRVVDEDLTLRSLVHHCWPYELRAGGMAAAAVETEAREALERWVSWGLPFARDGKTRRFDFREVLNFMSWVGRTHDDPVLNHGPVRTFRRAVTELSSDDARPGAGRDRHEFANFTVSLRREFHRPSAGVGSSTRFRVPLPLEGANLRDLDVALVEPDPTVTKFALAPGRLEIRDLFQGTSGPVAIDVRVRFAARAQTCVIDPSKLENWDRAEPDYVLYTNRHEGLIQVTDWVVQTAEQLAKGTHDAWGTVKAFWSFFLERLSSGRIHHDELDASDPLHALAERGWFDCFTGSALFAAFCRARGIPARVVNGFTLYAVIPSNHYWVEVHLPPFGWVPVDTASWDLAATDVGDEAWNTFFLGHLDARMPCQCFPHRIVGPAGVRFPPSWYVLPAVRDGGLEASYFDLATGGILYRDWVRVERAATLDPVVEPDEPCHHAT